MRHRIYGKQLNRKSAHRTAMLRNLAAGLFEHGQIETTLPKAKAVQGFAEKLITLAKTKSLHSRRQLERKINDRNILQQRIFGADAERWRVCGWFLFSLKNSKIDVK